MPQPETILPSMDAAASRRWSERAEGRTPLQNYVNSQQPRASSEAATDAESTEWMSQPRFGGTLSLGATIRAARKDKNMSLEDLATKATVAKGNLSKIENGEDNVTVATLRALAGALDTTAAKLLDLAEM